MSIYKVEISETSRKTIYVEAETREDAIEFGANHDPELRNCYEGRELDVEKVDKVDNHFEFYDALYVAKILMEKY